MDGRPWTGLKVFYDLDWMAKPAADDPGTWPEATPDELRSMFARASPDQAEALLAWAKANWIVEPGRIVGSQRVRHPTEPSLQVALMPGLDFRSPCACRSAPRAAASCGSSSRRAFSSRRPRGVHGGNCALPREKKSRQRSNGAWMRDGSLLPQSAGKPESRPAHGPICRQSLPSWSLKTPETGRPDHTPSTWTSLRCSSC